jgi:hypothetical protein
MGAAEVGQLVTGQVELFLECLAIRSMALLMKSSAQIKLFFTMET